jgi:hypothetical protein
VVIEFDAWGADLVRGRQWHSSQVLNDRPDGGARLTMLLNSLEEIERWEKVSGRDNVISTSDSPDYQLRLRPRLSPPSGHRQLNQPRASAVG